MARFSERYGYVKPNDIIVRECITEPIRNSICNWLNLIRTEIRSYKEMDKYLWTFFFNRRNDEYPYLYYPYHNNYGVGLDFVVDDKTIWYNVLDLIEFVCCYYSREAEMANRKRFVCSVEYLNLEFERHNFAYRLIDDHIVEITSESEIKSIEEAINNSGDNVRVHLQNALEKLSPSKSDYRNSIKESISAVECICREITGESTLDRALKNLENKGVVLNPRMKEGLKNLYFYTNDGSTGIRHALMDDANAPTADDAIFMLVSCSAFVNYLIKKK